MKRILSRLTSALKSTDINAIAFVRGLRAFEAGDFTTAMNELRPLAEKGYTRAQVRVGVMHDTGQGVPRNVAEAERWFHLAAKDGNADAQCKLGQKYDPEYYAIRWLNGISQKSVEERDYKVAERWYRLAAEQGHPWAQFRLGLMYFSGWRNSDEVFFETDEDWFLEPNEKEARRWINLAAKNGNPDAQCILGNLEDDRRKAIQWFRLAASQNYAPAQHEMGIVYSPDLPFWHVERDTVEAARWFRLAAEQGHEESQWELAKLYLKGDGVPKDKILAYMWGYISHETIKKTQPHYSGGSEPEFEKLENEMTAEEIASARARAQTCISSNFKVCN
ncbi:tetratricopeptide repeat protein [Alterinioella nitratireducens]|uniref:tetratricopeptide repeat protein n=1 Tax=Alterinioella nitratireducens TaxID=2735915 RepID=UPI00155517D9|nr:SEL1-like repeat protein [Alterinioella nitratireducens]NPD21510.1 SEL1-like repeat protein [Alterinioella nitratireducens]